MLWRKLQRHINKIKYYQANGWEKSARVIETGWDAMRCDGSRSNDAWDGGKFVTYSINVDASYTICRDQHDLFCVGLLCGGMNVNKSWKLSTYDDNKIYLHLIHHKMFSCPTMSSNRKHKRHIQRDFMLCCLPKNLLFTCFISSSSF